MTSAVMAYNGDEQSIRVHEFVDSGPSVLVVQLIEGKISLVARNDAGVQGTIDAAPTNTLRKGPSLVHVQMTSAWRLTEN